MNAIEILEQQHREVEDLFASFKATTDLDQRIQIFNDIADALAAHATIEERVFYPGVKVGPTEDQLEEAIEEHLEAKKMMAQLLSGEEIDEEQFEKKVLELQESVDHHVEEEEDELFVKVRGLFGSEELDALGVEMENLYADLMSEGEPRSHIPEEASRPPPSL